MLWGKEKAFRQCCWLWIQPLHVLHKGHLATHHSGKTVIGRTSTASSWKFLWQAWGTKPGLFKRFPLYVSVLAWHFPNSPVLPTSKMYLLLVSWPFPSCPERLQRLTMVMCSRSVRRNWGFLVQYAPFALSGSLSDKDWFQKEILVQDREIWQKTISTITQ